MCQPGRAASSSVSQEASPSSGHLPQDEVQWMTAGGGVEPPRRGIRLAEVARWLPPDTLPGLARSQLAGYLAAAAYKVVRRLPEPLFIILLG
jgi:hypothetical protein